MRHRSRTHRARCPGRALAAIVVLAWPLGAAAEPAKTGWVPLTDRAWAWIAERDDSSNGVLFVGEQAALVVDPGATPTLAREFLAGVRELTDVPVRWAVLTHAHPDHALGTVLLESRAFETLAHPNARRALAERGAEWREKLASAAESDSERDAVRSTPLSLPERVIEQRELVDLGDHEIQILPMSASHTSGDLVVWSRSEKVLAAGDLYPGDACPSIGEGSVFAWTENLEALERRLPRHVVPGHFGVGSIVGLTRFRAYLEAQMTYAKECYEADRTPAEVRAGAKFPRFEGFRESPRFAATFADNAEAVVRELRERLARPDDERFVVGTVLGGVGEAPHQISFDAEEKRAYVAAAGSDRITVIDAASREIVGEIPVEGTPLGVVELPSRDAIAVTPFRSTHLLQIDLEESSIRERLFTGEGSSLFVPLPNSRYLVSTEDENRLHVFDARAFEFVASYATEKRPFPAGPTSDGRKAFVPNYEGGTLTVVDLWNDRVLDTVKVGGGPSGATVLPGDVEVAVALRGLDHLAFFNTASHRLTGRLRRGIGGGPFSIVVSPDGAHAFVANTTTHDVSVLALPEKRVVARVPVGEVPIAMAFHELTNTLWVSCEGTHDVHVIEVPATSSEEHGVPADSKITEVTVLGTIHGDHLTSESWGVKQVEAAIRRYRPDVVCAEIPPDRWERIWADFANRGVIEDSRIQRFPEYTEVLLPLKVELGFDVEPCAAWTREMADARREKIRAFEELAEFTERKAAYDRENAEIESRHAEDPIDREDPFVIHSEEYDRRIEAEAGPYDTYLNDWIGPGGWTNVNEAHWALIENSLEKNRGRRLLITFGSGHKYWFLRELAKRDDVRIVDAREYLVSGG